MSWPELMEPELQAYIEARQATALRTYENDPDLLIEHVRQEDSFRTGGYGTRQISELLQNAVDAVGASGGTGMVELRLADGALYCANEGQGFTRDGLRAVTYAFLSTKRGEEIGRFGLGFKSILGITDHPQIYSRSVSFEFNAPDTAELFSGLPMEGGRLPLLRIPTLAEPSRAAADDPNIAEMRGWATTIVKLPLIREGDRLRKELLDFSVESLLFFKPLERLRISVQASPGAAPDARDYVRVGHPDDGEVHLIAPGGERERWLYAEREYRPTIDVASTLPPTAQREAMKVSYAVRPEVRAGVGRLWAWFPLNDETTASGVFNAPWQINDDRTSLVPGSLLNRAMLGVAADLFLDVATRASTPADTGAHLDLFPARGREARSNADTFLSDEIPRRAIVRPMIPDVTGELKVPGYFVRVPDLQKTPIPPSAARAWQERAPRSTMPHWQCFTTPTRRLRLRTLLGGSDEQRSSREASVASWLEELARRGEMADVEAALFIAASLAPVSSEMKEAVGSAQIVPLEDGGWARAGASASVLLPLDGAVVPAGVKLVDPQSAAFGDVSDHLRALGFRVVSADETASALGHGARDRWSTQEWRRFWTVIGAASPHVAATVIRGIRGRGVDVLLPTKAGTWRPACEVLADPTFATEILDRHVDTEQVPNMTLVREAGAVDAPKRGYPLHREALRSQYVAAIESMARAYLAREGYEAVRVVVPDTDGVGPLAILQEKLTDAENVFWTRAVLRAMPSRDVILKVPLGRGKTAEIPASSFEWWAVRGFGKIATTLGPCELTSAVSSRLMQFGAYLPVAADAELSAVTGLAAEVSSVPDSLLRDFLGKEGYQIASTGPDAFVELLRVCAARDSLSAPGMIPAVLRGTVILAPANEVAVTDKGSDVAALDEAGVAHIPTHGEHGALVNRWSLLTPGEALQQSLEVSGMSDTTPVLDLYPSLQARVVTRLAKQKLARAESIARVLQSIHGVTKRRLMAAKQDGVVIVDASMDDQGVLEQLSAALDLGLSADDVRGVIEDDERMRRSGLIQKAQLARTNEERLLILVGADTLRQRLPKGLLPAVESRTGELGDRETAELFLQVQGQDAVRAIRDDLARAGIPVPKQWDGSPSAQSAVKRLGFDTSYAGSREARRASVTQVQGQVFLNELHDFQQALAAQITDLATTSDPVRKRGLLYLPTGAGKTRVTVEALLHLLKSGDIEAPVLWIAQNEELCEQAITAFAEVWRWMGDERPLDVSRFWSGHELDESNEELQVVVAIDDTLVSRLDEPQYGWLTGPGIVVIDEAHTAGTKTYTAILRSLGLTARRTERPLLGLTATPYRGRSKQLTESLVERFGSNRLESLDPDNAIGELRGRGVLSEVDYDILDGVSIAVDDQDAEFRKWNEVTPNMLALIGQDMGRTQGVVDHIRGQLTDEPDWPVLVFAASVASAHTIAALLRLQNVRADSVDGGVRKNQRRRVIERFKSGESQVLVNCDLLTQGFDAPKVRALYIARPTFSPNRYLQMVGRGLRGPANGGTDRCLVVNVADTFEQFGKELAYNEFDYLWSKK
ncbi:MULTISPECIES: DEAD/DEAH box helicase family protein [unclassified Microbacterium]|uniref:DEAD/DEAH box helicase family protein n=1 Tax=unclassified Microbacterium TaxID=2609290 RepID=UPI00214AD721|nr:MULTISPECIES: DEAD/DEAH box helicase family protein [unclassified Microbacterium]MCR2784151.1 DEAD/DEAH box helicase family protein [Microbacterium sp. zg.B96]WIM15014.1 DEAD/DEAH box helicase family protein [Microbacterium sp. zg-B96]